MTGASLESSAEVDGNLIRRRNPSPEAASLEDASQLVRELNADPKSKKTYGRTPAGQVFIVPQTHDMVSQLLDPRQTKNFSDIVVLVILGLHILAANLLPATLKCPVFAGIFLLWRAAYNIGIGCLLNVQSNHKLLVTWARRWKLFESPEPGRNPRPWLFRMLKSELEAKIPLDYKVEKAPIEYNTWLVFRRLVDLILMCDFMSYSLFAIVCSHQPHGETLTLALARWVVGVSLIGFNLWVKLDAHRVVKDYAWYWGDFFFLIDQDLTFDGVFEMAPHPMYSIGYAGYYGISMIAASYEVLFISILAHAAQFAFLVTVENPHIEKTYNPPPPRMRHEASLDEGSAAPTTSGIDGPNVKPERISPAPVHSMLGLSSFDLFRASDYAILLTLSYLAGFTLATPRTPFYQSLFVVHALLWRLWFSVGLGIVLTKQSNEKMFTRHFLKYGDSVGEAWNQWKALYHVSVVLCHASFIAACYKMYSLPEDWNSGWALLQHVLGLSLILLQAWTTVSIYESLGEFGWFYGDFFFDSTGRLTYKSIYRYLNNPERVLGTAGLWGAALMTWSRPIFVMALVGHLLTLAFISYVEKPHMQKTYGRNLREEAGLTKFIKRTLPNLPAPVKGWQTSVDKVLDETKHLVDDFVDTARSKLTAGSSCFVKDTSAIFNKYPARLTITRIAPDLAGFAPKHYKLTVEGTPLHAVSEKSTGKESITARVPKAVKTLAFEYGAPIKVRWTAPANHSKKDWVGLYMVTDNRSREFTEVSSLGRWVPTCPGVYDTSDDTGILVSDNHVLKHDASSDVDLVQGEMTFSGDKLWWTQGVFEFRYHHDGNHNVMSISEPFEVRIGRFDEEDLEIDSESTYEAVIKANLLPVVRNCLDRDPNIAPETADEKFGSQVERDSKYAKRVVYAIRHMFGIEFAPAVVPADRNVRKLAWRIYNAKQVLVSAFTSSSILGSLQYVTIRRLDDPSE